MKKAKSDIENDAQFNTDKSSLQNEVDGKDKDGKVITPKFEDTPEFNNAAGSSAANAYVKALADAKKVLADKNSTQKQVDEALKALQDAKKAISQFSTDKSKLRNEVEGKDSDGNIITPKFNESAEYKNAEAKANATPADEDAKKDLENYTNALNEANSVLNDSSASQSAVDAALKRLQEAKKKIADSNKTDKSKLQSEADGDADFRKSPYFIIGSRSDISEYEKALAEAKSVLNDPNATQAEVDEALKRLAAAKNKINNPFGRGGNGSGSESGADFGSDSGNSFGYSYGNGYGHVYDSDGLGDSSNGSADKSALRAEVAEAENINAGNANSADANAYFDALSNARRVLNDPNATQAQVDAALRKLQAAKAALLNSLSGASGHKIAKTGAATGLFAGFAVIFAGLGAAGVASRRRKHSKE